MYLKLTILPTLIPLLIIPVTASATDYTCYRAAKPSQIIKQRRPQGNWGPQHNTNNWTYSTVKGRDIYRHRKGRRVVGTRCKGPGYNHGQLRVDFIGNQDWCVKVVGGWGSAHTNPSCPSGYTLSPNKQQCKRPSIAGKWKKNRHPRGNWGPQHNTSNWSYSTIKGKDIYRHKKGRRVVGTRCKGIRYNYGQHKVDLVGNQDWCATWQSGQNAHQKLAYCPANYTLTPKRNRPTHPGRPIKLQHKAQMYNMHNKAQIKK